MIASFLWELAPWNLENICKSTNNLSFLCQFFINEITASDAGPDIIRSHLLYLQMQSSSNSKSADNCLCWVKDIEGNDKALVKSSENSFSFSDVITGVLWRIFF